MINIHQKLERIAIEALIKDTNTDESDILGYKDGNKLLYIDNITAQFDYTDMPMHRETGNGNRANTWCRARAVIYALLSSLNLTTVLPLIIEDMKHIRGLGISDDDRYANALSDVFTYSNTFYHKEPLLDLMSCDSKLVSTFDFITCSDVLEHVVGDWRNALKNLFLYLRPNGVLILTVPLKKELDSTIEHYPNAIGYDVIEMGSSEYSVRIKYENAEEIIDHFPIFHGGPGNTLEMRQFALSDLVSEIQNTGFAECNYHELNQPLYGICPDDKYEGVIVATK